MKKFCSRFFEQFAFNRHERYGITALSTLLFLLIVSIQIVPLLYVKEPDLDIEFIAEEIKVLETKKFSSLSGVKNKEPPKKAQQAFERKVFKVKANEADTLDLQEIRGIGPGFAKRIINYRELLGGFVTKEQLKEVWGIDSAKYEQIQASFIIDKANIRKIDLNTVSLNELKKHPYIDYYQAKAIIQKRETEGLYQSVGDIRLIPLIDDSTFSRLSVYLEVVF